MSDVRARTHRLALLLVSAIVCISCSFDADPIAQAGRETRRILSGYASAQDAKAIQAWLLENHGEAPGSEVMIEFVTWAVQHPRHAEEIVASLVSYQEMSLARRVAWAAVDSGIERSFVDTFRATDSRFFRLALELCRDFEQCAAAMSSNTSLERTGEG